MNGSLAEVDYVTLPCDVVSSAANARTTCRCEDDLQAALEEHWKASGKRFIVEGVLAWAMDHSPTMTAVQVTANLQGCSLPESWVI